MISDIEAFIKKLQHLIDGDTRPFPVLSEKISQSPLEPYDSEYHVEIVSNLKDNFKNRLKDISEIAILAQFVVSPSMEIDIQQFATSGTQNFSEDIAATEMENYGTNCVIDNTVSDHRSVLLELNIFSPDNDLGYEIYHSRKFDEHASHAFCQWFGSLTVGLTLCKLPNSFVENSPMNLMILQDAFIISGQSDILRGVSNAPDKVGEEVITLEVATPYTLMFLLTLTLELKEFPMRLCIILQLTEFAADLIISDPPWHNYWHFHHGSCTT
ncbi:unnamed protein product [Acanthoscelides obtectus]|uniref:Uncharacterized protein n=1 Tax=Acanthoscelides obtectus TaxID=200917 RepID=A0A9P0NTP8_ACAOB|nr:unnamed protein product [Acanthoscelides obtectus]CAK1678893.1 hypothetical protein AOBTE_LOCUS32061 [Acanthoscelides obtectus]